MGNELNFEYVPVSQHIRPLTNLGEFIMGFRDSVFEFNPSFEWLCEQLLYMKREDFESAVINGIETDKLYEELEEFLHNFTPER